MRVKSSAAISIATGGGGGGGISLLPRESFCGGRDVEGRLGGLISTGGTFSTGGNDAQGDLTGAGAAGFATSVGLSDGVFKTSPPDLGCAAERGFNTVAFGPTVVVGFCCADNLDLFSSACRSFAIKAAACSSARMAAESFCDSVILVPSFHSIVSGAQSSSSSSISAHLDSLPSPSACSRVARCMPYCCLSSSSVKCFCAGWGAAKPYQHRRIG